MDWTDEEAASETQRGNQYAFRVLVERYSRPIFRLAFRMTGNEQDAEDLVQETFLRVYKYIDNFDGRASFSTWIYRIATNCSLDFLRARKVRAQLNADMSKNDSANWLEQIAANEPSPDRLTQSGRIAVRMTVALAELTEPERAAFVLRHYEGRSIDEIASNLGVRQGAAKQAIFRAVQKLRRSLAPESEMAR